MFGILMCFRVAASIIANITVEFTDDISFCGSLLSIAFRINQYDTYFISFLSPYPLALVVPPLP